MTINELTHEQKETFCNMMAQLGFNEEISSAYCNALDFCDIEEPNQFEYHDGIGGELFQEVCETMTRTMYLRLMFAATFEPEYFIDIANENNGYKFALSQLENIKSLDSEDDFQELIDSLDE